MRTVASAAAAAAAGGSARGVGPRGGPPGLRGLDEPARLVVGAIAMRARSSRAGARDSNIRFSPT